MQIASSRQNLGRAEHITAFYGLNESSVEGSQNRSEFVIFAKGFACLQQRQRGLRTEPGALNPIERRRRPTAGRQGSSGRTKAR